MGGKAEIPKYLSANTNIYVNCFLPPSQPVGSAALFVVVFVGSVKGVEFVCSLFEVVSGNAVVG